MPRDIPVGNGQMLVTFDQHYQVRDLYFPHVGQENHAGGGPCRFGVWSPLPVTTRNQHDRRRQRLYWSNQGWQIALKYQPDTLATDVVMRHEQLQLELRCCDVVDFHRTLLVRRIDVVNLSDHDRQVHLFHHNDFNMFGTKVGDTAYFDPQLRCMIHYRGERYLMACWHADGEPRIDEYAAGVAGFQGAEGTWRDAEDGTLGGNPIAQGAVDSTIMIQVALPKRGRRTAYLLIGAGYSYKDVQELHRFIYREGPQGSIDRTRAYWTQWLGAARSEFPSPQAGGPSPQVIDLFKRSLLVLRTQIDNTGAIIAANDSDIMQFSRDTYSYLWPRDGALVAAALDDAGFPDVARSFYALCGRIISDFGCFLHKYSPDGALASSWHPWVSIGRPQLPIQEDETALVLWALWRHYDRYRDIEFVRGQWANLIRAAADFLVRFRDPDTKLPLPSYDLWEERWGVHAFTVAAVYAGLSAAAKFAVCFGDTRRARAYEKAAAETRQAFGRYLWFDEYGRFVRRIVPLDHARTARLMAHVYNMHNPQPEFGHDGNGLGNGGNGNGQSHAHGKQAGGRDGDASTLKPRYTVGPAGRIDMNGHTIGPTALFADPPLEFEIDPVIDSSMYAIFAMGLLDAGDERVRKTMRAIEEQLTIRTGVGGVARYAGDNYHRTGHEGVPGNPWFICTLWLAQWHIERATNVDELKQVLPTFEWVARHALPSGVLAEQVHPFTNAPLSVSPLTWSHATVVATVEAYLRKIEQMTACPSCGQPRHAGDHSHAGRRARSGTPGTG